jgi:hypothetical protein
MIEKGKRAPNIRLDCTDGAVHQLDEFNQKTHVALVVSKQNLDAEVKSRAKTWDWLKLKMLVVVDSSEPLPEGVTLIDRFGYLISVLPITPDVWEKVEKELIYYEARHC